MMQRLIDIELWLVSLARPAPARDWFITLVLVFLIFISTFVFAANLFWGIRSGGIVRVSADAPTGASAVSRAELNAALEAYEKRAINFEAHNFPVRELTDPQSP